MLNAPWGKWSDAKIVKTDAANEIKNLKLQQGKNMVLWGSISLAQSLMKENLIDEYQLPICPVPIGEGKPLFPKDIGALNFKVVEIKKYPSGLVLLDYIPK